MNIDDIKCPICGGMVIVNPFEKIDIIDENTCSKKFKLSCFDCGLTSKEIEVFVKFGYGGYIEVNKDNLELEINNWRRASEK